MKTSSETAVHYKDIVKVFIDNLSNEAHEFWRKSFLKALQKKGMVLVVQMWLHVTINQNSNLNIVNHI